MSPVEAVALRETIHVQDKQDVVDHFLEESATVDFAVESHFFNELSDIAEGNEHRNVCMVYDEDSNAFGCPQPLTRDAYGLLAAYDKKYGSSYEEDALFPPKRIESDHGIYLVGSML